MGCRHITLAVLLLLPAAAWRAPVACADGWSGAQESFRHDMAKPDWKARRAAFLALIDWDGAEALREALRATLQEKNGAVVLEGIKTIATFQTPEAQAALLEELAKARDEKSDILLMALAQQKGPSGVDELLALLHGREPQRAALAALALGGKKAARALPALLGLLQHKEWQVVSAAARAVREMAWSEWTKPDMKKGVAKQPKMPAWFDVEKVRAAFIAALGKAEGTARGDVIRTLEFVTKKDFGDNPAAWQAFAQGKPISQAILAKRVYPPCLMGVPVWGRRVVVVEDVNARTQRPHPFQERARLQELCKVPGGGDLDWSRMHTVRDFNDAWVTRFIQDLPTKGTRFEIVFSATNPQHVFDRLQPVGSGSKRTAIESVARAPTTNGNDVLTAMSYALDVAGEKDRAAWRRGPEVVCCIYSSVPWQAKVIEADVVGADVALKARRRLVKIHAIGVHEYAYGMMELFAKQTGGVYRQLSK